MENELQVAREIQLSMLSHNFVHLRRADAHAFMRPAKFVGGDRLKLEIRQHQDEDAHSMTDDVERAVESFVGEAEQSDDLTMLCIKMH